MNSSIKLVMIVALVLTQLASGSGQAPIPTDPSGVWCSSGGCEEFELVLTRHGNRVIGTIGDFAAEGFQADFEFIHRGGRFNYLFTLTVQAGGECSPATFTGTAHIDTVDNILTALSSGTNTDCFVEDNNFVLMKQ